MNKLGWAIGVIVLLAALYGAYSFITRPDHAVSPTPQANGTGNASVGANGASAVIIYKDTGFSPSPFTAAVGTTITWSNQSSHQMRIEGTDFDEGASVAEGGSYSHTFTTAGTFTYANHERTGDTATIVVVEAAASGPINPNAIPE